MLTEVGVWGEGFADDGWTDDLAVTTWRQLQPDEAIRLFPQLVAKPGACPSALVIARLASAIAAARRAHAGRSAARGRGARLLVGPPPVRAFDDRVLDSLEAIVEAAGQQRVIPYAEPTAFAMAFVAGVHPAYLWPEAALARDSLTAAGWIGVLARGRPALLTLDVAEVLAHAVDRHPPRAGRLLDPRLAVCGLSMAEWSRLARFAQRRLCGRRDVVRLPPPRATTPRFTLSWLRPSRRLAEAPSR